MFVFTDIFPPAAQKAYARMPAETFRDKREYGGISVQKTAESVNNAVFIILFFALDGLPKKEQAGDQTEIKPS